MYVILNTTVKTPEAVISTNECQSQDQHMNEKDAEMPMQPLVRDCVM